MTRKEIADGLKKAAASYLLHRGYACQFEIGLVRRGRLRADVLAVNLRSELFVVEIKSILQDFNNDNLAGKWIQYLPFCNRMAFCFTEETAQQLTHHFPRFRELGCGVLVLDSKTGYLRSVVSTKYRKMIGPTKRLVVTRLAWRNGAVSRRTNRRVRVFLE